VHLSDCLVFLKLHQSVALAWKAKKEQAEIILASLLSLYHQAKMKKKKGFVFFFLFVNKLS